MFHRFSSKALVLAAAVALSIPAAGLAQHRGGGGSHFSGGSHSSGGGDHFSGGGHFSGGRSFVAPRGEFSHGYRGGSRWYGGPLYRGYYGPSVGLYFGSPYYYSDPYFYDPGYYYNPGYTYTGPAPAPVAPQPCSPGGYDQYGNWVPNSNCVNQPQQYQQQPNYYPNQVPPYGR